MLAWKKFPNWAAEESIINRCRKLSFCVAIPPGQLLLLQALIPKHPMACNAELETAMASAPNIIAFAKSSGTLKPPVITKVTSRAPTLSKCFLARASAGIVGTLILSLNMVGAEPVPPPLPSSII